MLFWLWEESAGRLQLRHERDFEIVHLRERNDYAERMLHLINESMAANAMQTSADAMQTSASAQMMQALQPRPAPTPIKIQVQQVPYPYGSYPTSQHQPAA